MLRIVEKTLRVVKKLRQAAALQKRFAFLIPIKESK